MLKRPEQGAARIFQFHQKDYYIPEHQIKPIPTAWLAGYHERGIDMSSVFRTGSYRWDREVLELFAQCGTRTFKKLDIWGVDWEGLRRRVAPKMTIKDLRDPRSITDKIFHRWLRHIQPYYSHYSPPTPFYVKAIEKVIQLVQLARRTKVGRWRFLNCIGNRDVRER